MTGIAPQTELIIELLAKGVPQHQICTIADTCASTVSEVASTHSELIALTATGSRLMQYEMDELRDNIELQALKQLQKCIPLETDASKLARIATAINGMSRRSIGEKPTNTNVNVTVTQLNLPTNFMQQRKSFEEGIVLNAASEVVAIGDRTTAPASRDQIERMAAQAGLAQFANLITVNDLA
jgi:hypothetical protein